MNLNFKKQYEQKNNVLAFIVIVLVACILGALIWLNKNKQDNPVDSQQSQVIKKNISQAENSIIGEWFPLNVSKGGLGAGVTFFADGKVITTYGAYVHFKYKLEGNTLTMFTEFPNTPDVVQNVQINDSKMIISKKDGEQELKQELTRISGDPNAGIIGKWTGERYTGGTQIIDFTTSGNAYLSVPMSPEDGRYQINGNIIEFSRKINTDWQLSIDGDNFAMTSSDGKHTQKYMRIK